MLLSIIIPARNEEKRLPQTLRKIINYMSIRNSPWECLVVNNGSSDNTANIAREFSFQCREIRVLESDPGKGAAIKCGMLAARGQYRYMCDADLSTPIGFVCDFISAARLQNTPNGFGASGCDIVIGSRNMEGSTRENEPENRHYMGIVFNSIVQMLLLYGISDSQCGFKLFSARAADDLFSRSVLDGFAFDVEILYLARRLGYSIYELPVKWVYDPDTRVQGYKTALSMFLDVLKIGRNAKAGVYGELSRARPENVV